MALGERVERGETRGRLDLAGRDVLAQRADELVDLAERVARDLFDCPERGAGSRRIPFLQQAGRTRLDEDHVDRVPGRVVQVAGDAHALLRRGEPPLSFGLALGVPGALLELGDPLPTEPRPVSGEPGGRPYPGTEEDLWGKAVPHEVRSEKSQGAGRDKDPA